MAGLQLWLQSRPFKICMFLSGFQMIFYSIAAISLDFKWLGFQISDLIGNPDHLQPNLFFIFQNPAQSDFRSPLYWISKIRKRLKSRILKVRFKTVSCCVPKPYKRCWVSNAIQKLHHSTVGRLLTIQIPDTFVLFRSPL